MSGFTNIAFIAYVTFYGIRLKLECQSCKEILRINSTVMLPCRHTFCNSCVKDSFRKGERKCPDCSKHVPVDVDLKVPNSEK